MWKGIESTAFLDFLSGAVPGDWPVAVAPDQVLAAIGGRSRTVRLPSDSVPDYQDLEGEDWLHVQRIVDQGLPAGQAGGALDDDGSTRTASLIAAQDEDGNSPTYLGSLERR